MAPQETPEDGRPEGAADGLCGRTIHASCVAVGGAGVLIRGPSGAGKSSLALKLIVDAPRVLPPAELVADDRVLLRAAGGALFAYPAPVLAGLLEVRGLGIRRFLFRDGVRLTHVIDLGAAEVARMPLEEAARAIVEDCSLQHVVADGVEHAALLLAAVLVSAEVDT